MKEKIIEIIKSASHIMLENENAAIHEKEGHYNFVTDADIMVQQYLSSNLLPLVEGSSFFAEEKANEALTDGYTWMVDPIDGTINFMRHRHCSSISVALLKNKTPVLAFVYNPYKDEMFSAEKEKGAFLNEKKISVSDTIFSNALINIGTAPYNTALSQKCMRACEIFLRNAGDLRRTGSAAIDLCELACGRCDVFFELMLSPWDYAAGYLIAAEAGAKVVSPDTESIDFGKPSSIVAANPFCFEDALKIVKEA